MVPIDKNNTEPSADNSKSLADYEKLETATLEEPKLKKKKKEKNVRIR